MLRPGAKKRQFFLPNEGQRWWRGISLPLTQLWTQVLEETANIPVPVPHTPETKSYSRELTSLLRILQCLPFLKLVPLLLLSFYFQLLNKTKPFIKTKTPL